MRIQYYKWSEIKEAVDLSITYRLYVSGWMARRLFRDFKDGYGDATPFNMALAFEGDKPIAWVIRFHGPSGVEGTSRTWRFTRVAHRGKGISTMLRVTCDAMERH